MGGADVTVIRSDSAASRIVGRLQLDNKNSIAIYEAMLPFTIGRSNDNDLVIPEGHVSRHHCEVTAVGGVLCLRDTSANGTFIGERQLNDTSVTIEGKTTINLGGLTRLKLTPLNETKDRRRCDRRDGDDRRDGPDRREGDPGQVIDKVIKFERRQIERRGDERRAEDRRTNDRRRVARG